MDRSIVYLFSDSSWMYSCEYNHGFHFEKGKYHQVIIGRGWSSREVGLMLREYYEENASEVFSQ